MDRESQYLLHLLGAFLRQEAPEVPGDLNWGKLLQLSKIHSVAGILGYMAMSWPICPDAKLQEALRTTCLNTIGLFSQRGALAELFSQLLEENEIDHIVMKGFVLRNYYPVPELRSYGDIDLVIRPEDRQKCHELMLAQGFVAETDWEPVFSYTRDGELYEIHTQIMEVDVSGRADYRGYFDRMWDYAQPVGSHSFVFTPEFHFLYVLTHIAKHVTGSGAGIRMYMDVAAFVQYFGTALDWNFVRQELEKLCLSDFANMVLTLVERYLGVKSPFALEEVKETVLKDFLEFTVTGGVFGKMNHDSGVNALKKQSRGEAEVSRSATFVRRLFPKAETIESRYTYLKDKPWLLPAAWVHRLFKNRSLWPDRAREVRNIMSTDLDEVRRLKRMYEEIGL